MGNQIGYKRHFNNNTLKTSQTSKQQKHILKDFLKMVIKRNQRGGSDKVLVKKVKIHIFENNFRYVQFAFICSESFSKIITENFVIVTLVLLFEIKICEFR